MLHESAERVGAPLLAAPVRRWALPLVGSCALFVAMLGVLFAHQARANRLDRAVDAPIIAWFGGHPGLAGWLAYPGSPIPTTLLSIGIVAGCLVAGRFNGAVLALLAVPVADGLVEGLLKPLFDRTYLGNVVYPSGHATAAFTLAAVLTVLLGHRGAGVRRPALPALSGLLGVTVAAAVIGLRWHYFTDTLAGAAVGIGTVCGLALLLDRPLVRSWLARATRPMRTREAQRPPGSVRDRSRAGRRRAFG